MVEIACHVPMALPIWRSTGLATVDDAFGAASRSLARSLTVAARDAWHENGWGKEMAAEPIYLQI
jgi:hypothetical protein